MFGKRRMSSNDRFVMAKGREAGNLKGRGTAPKSAPVAKQMKGAKPVPAPGTGTHTAQKRPLSPGQVNTVKT